MRRGISELFFVRAYKGRIVVKTAHLRGFYDRRPFIYQRTREEQTFTCNVIVNGVSGLVFEFSHHMIFAEEKLPGETVDREVFCQISINIFQKLLHLGVRRVGFPVWSSTAFEENPVDVDHKLCKKCLT